MANNVLIRELARQGRVLQMIEKLDRRISEADPEGVKKLRERKALLETEVVEVDLEEIEKLRKKPKEKGARVEVPTRAFAAEALKPST